MLLPRKIVTAALKYFPSGIRYALEAKVMDLQLPMIVFDEEQLAKTRENRALSPIGYIRERKVPLRIMQQHLLAAWRLQGSLEILEP